MLRRIAVKQGFYNASSYLHAGKQQQPDLSWLDNLRRQPTHYNDDQIAYFHEGFALGLAIADVSKHPFGELSCNGGLPMLPAMGDDPCGGEL